MPRSLDDWRRSEATALPGWIKPQLTRLVAEAPDGPDWLHEIKFDGYRMHARLDRGAVRLLTRTGLDWTHKYPAIAAAVALLPARQAYLDGELCGVRPDGTTSFSLIQNASDTANSDALVFFLFDLLHLDGEAIAPMPVTERKERLRALLSDAGSPLHFSDHQIGRGLAFYDHACTQKVEGIVSKRLDAPPRDSRFGSPLTLSRVHWVRPELVAEVKFLSWTEDNLLRQVVYEGLREDKPAAEVRRAVPYPKAPEPARPASPSKRPRSG